MPRRILAPPTDDELRAFLEAKPVIAMVGASSRPDRPSNGVMRGLLEAGYDVIPVNPLETLVHGIPAVADLRALPRQAHLVDVFRRVSFIPDVAREAADIGAQMLWLQLDLVSDEAARIAHDAGMQVVMDRCLIVEHHRLFGHP
jgi:predicted CoA-binding protein